MDCNNWEDNQKSFYCSYSRLRYNLETNSDFTNASFQKWIALPFFALPVESLSKDYIILSFYHIL